MPIVLSPKSGAGHRMRSVPPRWLERGAPVATHALPPATASPAGLPPTSTRLRTRGEWGSTRDTVAAASVATHTSPSAAATATGSPPMGTVQLAALVLG